MRQVKDFLLKNYSVVLLWVLTGYDRGRLYLAIYLAKTKYSAACVAKKPNMQYYVLPNQDEKLLVLNYAEIEKLKFTGEIEYHAVGRMKVYSRKIKTSKGIRLKRFRRNRIVGHKAFAVSHMPYKVGISDILRECFYHTPISGEGKGELTEQRAAHKEAQWIKYMQLVRQGRREDKKNKQAKIKK